MLKKNYNIIIQINSKKKKDTDFNGNFLLRSVDIRSKYFDNEFIIFDNDGFLIAIC